MESHDALQIHVLLIMTTFMLTKPKIYFNKRNVVPSDERKSKQISTTKAIPALCQTGLGIEAGSSA